jgi:LysR family cyn operon transcriptional activator
MDLRQLRYFVAVAELASFSRAAEQLHITQPALSRQIKELETELRLRLFDRLGRHIALTAAGKEVLTRSQALLNEASHLNALATELAGGSRGMIRLGATPQTLESLVSRLLARYRRLRPDVEVALVEDGAASLLSQVEGGLIHLAIAGLPGDTPLMGRVLFPLGVLAVLPQSHPLRSQKTLDVTDLANQPLLLLRKSFMTRQLFDGACQVAHLRPRILLESGSPHSLLALAADGHGIAVIPSTVRLLGVHLPVRPLHQEGRQLGLWMSIIWDPRRYLPPAAQLLVEETYKFTRRDYPGKAFRFTRLVDSSTARLHPQPLASSQAGQRSMGRP